VGCKVQCRLQGVAQIEGRKAQGSASIAGRGGRVTRGLRDAGVARGSRFPDGGGAFRRSCDEGREGREEVPAHLARLGTLTPWKGFERMCPPTLYGWAFSRQDGGLQEEVPARLGTLPLREEG
jgi:hypothetical protein